MHRKRGRDIDTECEEEQVVEEIDKDAIKEERQLRHWIIRWAVKLVSLIIVSTMTAILYGYLVQDKEFEGSVASGTIDNLFTVIRFMFN